MILQQLRDGFALREDLSFLLTNRIPRRSATRFMGWFSKIRHPWVSRVSLATWRLFADLDLSDAKESHFASLHDCFTRELRDGARPVDSDPTVLVSPCDAIVGATGRVEAGVVLQTKGFPYRLADLFGHLERAAEFEGGTYVTLRLTPTMYHRFHAPGDACVMRVTYISGDTWNVNPVTLERVERLFCRNERAVLTLTLTEGAPIALVTVAAILVAGIRLRFLDIPAKLREPPPHEFPCDHVVAKGEEMGWFEHGSTIIVFAPVGFTLAEGVSKGVRIRMGEALLRFPQRAR